MRRFGERFLVVYSGGLTLALAAVVLMGARDTKPATFEEINVQRINLREPDGTLRMVVSNRSRFPGATLKGREYAHDRGAAGMIFYNDEGSENGGLIFSGKGTGPDGKPQTFGHLSFDPYHRDQALALGMYEQAGSNRTGLSVNDVGDEPIEATLEAMERFSKLPEGERQAATERHFAGRPPQLVPRLFAGRSLDGDAAVQLRDGEGRVRMQLQVREDGQARIEFLDAAGKVQHAIAPPAGAE